MLRSKDIDIDQILNINKVDERIKKEIIYNYKYNRTIPAYIRFNDVTFYHKYYNLQISTLCKVFNVSRSAYYEYLKRENNKKESKDKKIIEVIKNIQEHYDYIYGINKVRLELKRNHCEILKNGTISRRKVYRLMKENGLLSRCICNKKNHVIYNSHNNIYKSLIGISTPTKNMFERLGTDVLERKTPEGKLYLSIVQEQCCDGIFGFVITRRMTYDIVSKTVEQAMVFVPGSKQMIIHSDRGTLYKTKKYNKLCEANNLEPSYSRPSTPTDNGQTESFFSCLVREKLQRITITSIKQLTREIENYIYFYNYVWINTRLGMSPMEYYNLHKNDTKLIADLHNREYSNFYDLIDFA